MMKADICPRVTKFWGQNWLTVHPRAMPLLESELMWFSKGEVGKMSPNTWALVPVPLRGITGAAPGALEGMVRVPAIAAAAVGKNRTWIIQVPAGNRVCPEQVSVPLVKSVVSVPATAAVPIKTLTTLLLVTVKFIISTLPRLTSPKAPVSGATAMLAALNVAVTFVAAFIVAVH